MNDFEAPSKENYYSNLFLVIVFIGLLVSSNGNRPTVAEGILPGILSPHGHWPKKEDYGRYRPDVQYRYAAMARMDAIVFTSDMVGYGQLAELGWKHDHPKTMKLQIWNSIRAVDDRVYVSVPIAMV